MSSVGFDPVTPTVFHEPWWLDAASDGNYREVTVTNGGKVVGRLPFTIARMPARCTLCEMPELTHFLGPAIDPGAGAPANRALKRDGILRELLEKLPEFTGFYQKFHRELSDALMFQEAGYRTAVQFTYEIEPAAEAEMWAAMRDKTRNVIRRGLEQYKVFDFEDPAAFAEMYDVNLKKRGLENHYRRIRPVCEAALAANQGRIIAARDASGETVAAIFYVWDARAGYYLLTTRNSNAANNAVSMLIWHGIQDCASRGLVFDFDGVATSGSRVFYTGFGGRIVPRYVVYRYKLIHRVAGRIMNPFRLPTKHNYQW